VVLLRDPLHRVAGVAAELVGAGGGHHHLRADHAGGADQHAQDDEGEDRPARAGGSERLPEGLHARLMVQGVIALTASSLALGFMWPWPPATLAVSLSTASASPLCFAAILSNAGAALPWHMVQPAALALSSWANAGAAVRARKAVAVAAIRMRFMGGCLLVGWVGPVASEMHRSENIEDVHAGVGECPVAVEVGLPRVVGDAGK